MLLGKDEDGNAGEQNIERIVVIKNITGRTLRLGVNDRREYREKKPRDTDAVEYDLLFAAEIPTAEIVSADKIDGKVNMITVPIRVLIRGETKVQNRASWGRRKVKTSANRRKYRMSVSF